MRRSTYGIEEMLAERAVEGPDGCRLWTGVKSPDGYGKVKYGGSHWKAHRLAWTLVNGPIPDGLTVDHLCFNTSCVNPDHLRLLTHSENAANKRVKETCVRGHLFSGDNLLIHRRPDGSPQRVCRECKRTLARKRWAEDPELRESVLQRQRARRGKAS